MAIDRVVALLTTNSTVMNAKGISDLLSTQSYITTCMNLVSLGLDQLLVAHALLQVGRLSRKGYRR